MTEYNYQGITIVAGEQTGLSHPIGLVANFQEVVTVPYLLIPQGEKQDYYFHHWAAVSITQNPVVIRGDWMFSLETWITLGRFIKNNKDALLNVWSLRGSVFSLVNQINSQTITNDWGDEISVLTDRVKGDSRKIKEILSNVDIALLETALLGMGEGEQQAFYSFMSIKAQECLRDQMEERRYNVTPEEISKARKALCQFL